MADSQAPALAAMTTPPPTQWSQWWVAAASGAESHQRGAAVCSAPRWCGLLSMVGPPASIALHGGRWGASCDERAPANPLVVTPQVPRFDPSVKTRTPVQNTHTRAWLQNMRKKIRHLQHDQTLASQYNPSTVCAYNSSLTNTSLHVLSTQYTAHKEAAHPTPSPPAECLLTGATCSVLKQLMSGSANCALKGAMRVPWYKVCMAMHVVQSCPILQGGGCDPHQIEYHPLLYVLKLINIS